MVKILIYLFLFLLVVFLPIGYNVYKGKTTYIPAIKTPVDQEECVENVIYMRKKHNVILERWRDASVREGAKKYVSINGIYKISLTGTCLGCHANKAEFCDRCHDYVGVKPKCWDCHHIPEMVTKR
ncbi:MAG TPA: sulfate reduction electron transfer complex DsrMKJOP subunit DsrJ [Syntrophorhabdaceae bacterium]|nr:sulfate reduction electron transfer complex DsrMKJOP subunit DsrJ [Syntrophorhabdaceae bacterium]